MAKKKSQLGDFIGFSFNNIHSSELGLVRVSDGNRYEQNLFPTISDKTIQVPGRDGFYYFGSSYNTKEIPIKVAFDNLEEKEFRKMVANFKDKKPHFLWFDECPYKEYLVKIKSPPNFKYLTFDQDGKRIYKGEGTIIFICYSPYARARARSLDDDIDYAIIKNNRNFPTFFHNHYLDGINSADNSIGQDLRSKIGMSYLEFSDKIEGLRLEFVLREKFIDFLKNNGQEQNQYPWYILLNNNSDAFIKEVNILKHYFLVLFYLSFYFGLINEETLYNELDSVFYQKRTLELNALQDEGERVYINTFKEAFECFKNDEEDMQNSFEYVVNNYIDSDGIKESLYSYSSSTFGKTFILLFLCVYYFLKIQDNFKFVVNEEELKQAYDNILFDKFYIENEENGLDENVFEEIIDFTETIGNVKLYDFYNCNEWRLASKMPVSVDKTLDNESSYKTELKIQNCGDIPMDIQILFAIQPNGRRDILTIYLKRNGTTINFIQIDGEKIRKTLNGADCEYYLLDSKTKTLQTYGSNIEHKKDWILDQQLFMVLNNSIIAGDFFKIPNDNKEYTIEISCGDSPDIEYPDAELTKVNYTYLYY